jgi:hypothetical protein
MPVSVMISKAYLTRIGGFYQDDGFPAVDFSTWVRLFELPGSVAWLGDHLGYWRQSNVQTSQRLGKEMAENALKIALSRFDQLQTSNIHNLRLHKHHIINERMKTTILPNYVENIRLSLIERNIHKVVFLSHNLIRYGSIKRKLQGIYAIIAVMLGWNMEAILLMYERLNTLRKTP